MADSNSLTVCSVSIRVDDDGRFCLNDLHRSSGGAELHKPGNWSRLDQTKALVAELESDCSDLSNRDPVVSVQGVGTYVVKELVYAYAMWISPKFHLQVIRAYDALVASPSDEHPMVAQARALLAYTQRFVTIEAEQAVQSDKIKRIEAKQQAFEEGSKFFTIIGYVVWKGLPSVSASEAVALGKRATKLSKEQGVLVDRVRDPRFGVVGSYHESILEAVFAEFLEGL